MHTKQFRRHRTKSLRVLFVVVGLASFSLGQSGAGTLSSVRTTVDSGTIQTCQIQGFRWAWKFTDPSGVAHTFPESTENVVESGRLCGHQTVDPQIGQWSSDKLYFLQAQAGTGYVSSLFKPDYEVVSILYSPPGNQSSQGYADATTNGTTTTITSSFTFESDLTFSSGIPSILGGSASVGWSTTSNNSSAFTQTFTDTTTLATDDNSNSTYNPTGSNAVNHNLDSFVIWLNPQVQVLPNETGTPSSYGVGSQSTSGVSAVVADIIVLPAITMKATPPGTAGVTTVPVQYLIPQAIASDVDGVNSYMPGLGAICKNNSLYLEQAASSSPSTPTYCTQSNQCGCTPSDFVNILQTDPLLNYNGTTLTAAPYAGTESPLELDGSGASACAADPVPTTDDCRYVIVPTTAGSTTPLFKPLSGSDPVTYMVSDTTTHAETTGHTISHSVGLSFGGGPIFASLVTKDTWTWTDGETVGSLTGTANSMNVSFKTSTAACDENVNLYEDTEYHTFAFQIPTGITTCP
jgi:hypothetical protein